MILKPELIGSVFAPKLRWRCPSCGAPNVSALGTPIRTLERVACKRCHRMSEFRFAPDAPPSA